MDERLLNKINKNLYDVESSIEVVKEDFKEYNIDIDSFMEILALYISSFSQLKDSNENNLINLLDEKLEYLKNHYHNLELWHTQIKASINFIEKHTQTFFNTKSIESTNNQSNDKFFYIDAIKIQNYFSIKDIEITNLNNKKEIYFVGENGDGKTILLQSILLALKKEYSGQVIEYIRGIQQSIKLSIKNKSSKNYETNINMLNVFAYGINRNKVRNKSDIYGYSGLFDTSDFKDTTFLKEPEDILKLDNKLVDKFIEDINRYILNENLTVEKKNNSLIFKENKQEISFDKLSEGYKSTIIWIFDLVSRLIENQNKINSELKSISEFEAIVLIDEVDLYLHPKWKYNFIHSIRKLFPNIQFIMITHSMVTILGASEDAVFYKVYKEDGETKISAPIENIKNFMANTLSTSPLFDMATARARNSDMDIDTSDDYLYNKIHKSISKRVQDKKVIVEHDMDKMIDEELDKFLEENDL